MNHCTEYTTVQRINHLKLFEVFFSIFGTWLLTMFLFQCVPILENTTVKLYVYMAEDPYAFVEFPYGSRILTPLVVYYLPFDIDDGFRIVAFSGIWLTGTLLYQLIRVNCSSILISSGLIGCFYLTSTIHLLTAHAWFIDPMSYLFLTLTFYSAIHKQNGITTAALTFGVLNRPSSILYMPVALLLCWSNQSSKKNILQSILIMLPACICVFLIFYVWPQASNFGVTKNDASIFQFNNPNEVNSIFFQQGFMFLLSPVIYKELLPCIWGTILIGIMHCERKILIACIATIVISILPMIAATDYFRLPFYSFPALFILSAIGFEQLHMLHSKISYFWSFVCIMVMILYPQSLLLGLIISSGMVCNYVLLRKTIS